MSSDMFFDKNDHWNSSGGIFDMVLEEIAATVSSTTVAELLLCVVENHIGMVGLDQLSASDQLEFLHAITGGLRDTIMAQIPADNPIRLPDHRAPRQPGRDGRPAAAVARK